MSMHETLRAGRPVLATFVAMGMAWGSLAADLPDVKAVLGVDETQLGLLLFFTPIAAVTAMILAPAIGARLGRIALPVSCGAMGLAFFLPGQVSVAWAFPLAMMCCGGATGLTDVLMNARTAEIENSRNLPLMNLAHAVYSLGYAGSAIGVGLLRAQGWGPGPVFAVVSLAVLLAALASWEGDGRIHGLARPAAGGRGLGLLPLVGGGIIMVAFLTENAAESWSALHIEKTLGADPGEGSFGPALLALTMGIARLAGQGLITRLDPFALLNGGAALAVVGALGASLATSPAMVYAAFVVMGVGASVISPIAFSLVGRLAAPEVRARSVARATLFGYLGYFVGPPSLGFIAGIFGLRAAFVFAALVLCATFVLAPLVARMARAEGAAR